MRENGSLSRRRLRAFTVCSLILGAGICYLAWFHGRPFLRANRDTIAQQLRRAQQLLQLGEYARAEQLAMGLLDGEKSASACLVAAQAAFKQERPDTALSYLDKVPPESSQQAEKASHLAVQILLRLGRLPEAEQRLRIALQRDADNDTARSQLAYLLVAEGRRWEAGQYLLEMIKRKQFTLEQLILLGDRIEIADYSDEVTRGGADNPSLLMTHARVAAFNLKFHKARSLAQEAIAASPNLIEAHVALGHVLVAMNDTAGLQRLLENLPPLADEHPDIWFLRGEFAHQQRALEAAARCYWEAVRRDPNRAETCYRLSQVLYALAQPDAAAQFLQRARDLDEFSTTMVPLYTSGAIAPRMNAAGRIAAALGRQWEAWAWYQACLAYFPDDPVARQQRDALARQLDDNVPQTIAACNPARHVDLSRYPQPDYAMSNAGRSAPKSTSSLRPIQFVDLAASAQLDFQYVNGHDTTQHGMLIYQEMAGGLAVLDFDGDGWPDIYCSQGTSTPPSVPQTADTDRLFRNLGNGQFADVTNQAGLGDTRFSQGVAVGDFNQDGFPDLLVANFGANVLYQNQGDGTFLDVTARAALAGHEWTTSCLLADFNDDGLPDIYLVNYVTGPDVMTKMCGPPERPHACSPDLFAAAPDQVYINQGNGAFREVSSSALPINNGRGLGVVAADFDGSGEISVLVSNDTTPNFFFTNALLQSDNTPVFEECGLVSGLGLNAYGHSQANMGIAVGDADQDGLLDLVVTTFYRESHGFYHQLAAGTFADEATETGIRTASLDILGFGAQFIDADLDGAPDLFVVNGHVDDLTGEGQPYRMPPHFFRNTGNLHYRLEPADQVGEYFAGERLGRSVALIDWDRDGRQDCVVMHLDCPVALLTNRSPQSGHFLCLRLHGVQSNRDAIGTRVQLQVGARTLYGQCVADGGFLASNQRQLVFGLGEATRIDELLVVWPSGQRQEFRDVVGDQQLVIVEGRHELFPLP